MHTSLCMWRGSLGEGRLFHIRGDEVVPNTHGKCSPCLSGTRISLPITRLRERPHGVKLFVYGVQMPVLYTEVQWRELRVSLRI